MIVDKIIKSIMISGLGTKLLKLFLTNILSLNLSQEMSLKVNYT